MKVTCEETSSTVTKINIEVPEVTVQSMLDERYRELTRTAKVAGFRKGKIPRSIIISKYQAAVTSDILNNLIPKSISTAIRDNNIRPVSQPTVGNVRLEEGHPLSFEATVEVIPKFKLKDFSDTELSCEIEKVNDESVDRVIERLRDSFGVLETAGSKTVEKGDYIVVGHKCVVDGQEVPRLTAKGTPLVVGNNNFFEGVEQGMLGMKKEESKDIPFTFPESFHMKGLAGKESVFTVTVSEIKHRKLPELNDEFAKQVANGETLEELKKNIRNDLEKNNRNNAMMEVKQKLLEKLVNANHVDVPEILKKAETDRLLDEHKQQAGSGEDVLKGEEELRAEMEKQAVHSLSREMIIDSFTEEHSISLSKEELSQEINRLAQRVGEAPQVFSRRLKEDQKAYANFEQRLLNEKTLDAMLDNIKIKEIFVSPESAGVAA